MLAALQQGGFVMVRQRSNRGHRNSPGGPVEDSLPDWPVYVAFLPAVLASAAIAITAALALGTAHPWHPSGANSTGVKITPGGDDYVEGLARLGIAKLPNYAPATVVQPGPGGGPLPLTQLARGCVILG
jgi:hypothetical protein